MGARGSRVCPIFRHDEERTIREIFNEYKTLLEKGSCVLLEDTLAYGKLCSFLMTPNAFKEISKITLSKDLSVIATLKSSGVGFYISKETFLDHIRDEHGERILTGN